jgi:hypothetical protein
MPDLGAATGDHALLAALQSPGVATLDPDHQG